MKLENLVTILITDGNTLHCRRNLCVPGNSISGVVHMAHDSNISPHFEFSKTMERLYSFHRRQKSRAVNKYIAGCIVFQQYEDRNQKNVAEPVQF